MTIMIEDVLVNTDWCMAPEHLHRSEMHFGCMNMLRQRYAELATGMKPELMVVLKDVAATHMCSDDRQIAAILLKQLRPFSGNFEATVNRLLNEHREKAQAFINWMEMDSHVN